MSSSLTGRASIINWNKLVLFELHADSAELMPPPRTPSDSSLEKRPKKARKTHVANGPKSGFALCWPSGQLFLGWAQIKYACEQAFANVVFSYRFVPASKLQGRS